MRRLVWTEPVRTDIRCRYCHKPLEAYGETVYKSARPFREFLWRHDGGAQFCTTTNRAAPSEFSYTHAEGRVIGALAGREAAEKALGDALGGES